MLHKIRKAISDRDAQYMLAGIVEMEDTYSIDDCSGNFPGEQAADRYLQALLEL